LALLQQPVADRHNARTAGQQKSHLVWVCCYDQFKLFPLVQDSAVVAGYE
jgi:hypothetical protein